MSVQISCFAHVVAEVTTIRSALTELLAQLERLEIMLNSQFANSAETPIVVGEPLTRAEAIATDVVARSEPDLVAATDEFRQDQPNGNDKRIDILDATPHRRAALVEALNDAILLPAAISAMEANSVRHAAPWFEQGDAACGGDNTYSADNTGSAYSNHSSIATTSQGCDPKDLDREVDDPREVAALTCQANVALEEPHHRAVAPSSETGAPDIQVALPVVVAAHLADETARIEAAPLYGAKSDLPQSDDGTAQSPACEPVLTVASTSTSLIVLPPLGAAARTRLPSRLGLRRTIAGIAASLVVCVGIGSVHEIIDGRWADALRIAVDGAVKSLAAPWKQAADAHGPRATALMLQFRQD